jgi:large subunit ribosomal protein L29
MSKEEMLMKLRELRAELARTRATVAAGGTLENPAKSKELKRTISRIITIMKEKERGGR